MPLTSTNKTERTDYTPLSGELSAGLRGLQLLEHFKELTVHPKNAEELKGLILQLAIQGKLTKKWRAENPNVEPASALLEQINREKEIEKANGRSNRGKLIDVIDPIEHYGNIPNTWSWLHLEDVLFYITDYQANGSFATLKENVTYYDSPNFAVLVRLKDLRHQLTRVNDFKYTDEKGYNFLSKSSIQGGEFLIANVGAGVGTIMEVPQISFKATLAPNMFCIYPSNTGIDRKFFKYYSKSPLYWMELNRHTKGTGQPKINKSEYRSCRFPLPPLEEQKAIVSIVNQLFTEVEALEQQTKAGIQLKEDFVSSALQQLSLGDTATEWAFLQTHFKTFFTQKSSVKKLRESILQLAVQGKLTHHWRSENPNTEDASVLLERIKAEKAQLIADKKIKKEKPLPEITKDEIPYALPDGWEWCRLGTVTDIIAGASFKSGDFNETGGAKCIKITNAGVRDFVETNDFLPDNFIEKYPNYLIKSGDLILALTRPYIKDGLKISTCPGSYDNSLLNQRVAAIRSMTQELFHPYVFSFIQSPHVLNYYKSKFDGKSQQPNMKMGDITELLFAVPPLAEQKAIVSKVNALMALCDGLEKEIETHQTTQEHWRQSCLKEVFES